MAKTNTTACGKQDRLAWAIICFNWSKFSYVWTCNKPAFRKLCFPEVKLYTLQVSGVFMATPSALLISARAHIAGSLSRSSSCMGYTLSVHASIMFLARLRRVILPFLSFLDFLCRQHSWSAQPEAGQAIGNDSKNAVRTNMNQCGSRISSVTTTKDNIFLCCIAWVNEQDIYIYTFLSKVDSRSYGSQHTPPFSQVVLPVWSSTCHVQQDNCVGLPASAGLTQSDPCGILPVTPETTPPLGYLKSGLKAVTPLDCARSQIPAQAPG